MTLQSYQNSAVSPACDVTFIKIFLEEFFLIWFDFDMYNQVPFSGLPPYTPGLQYPPVDS